MSFAPSTHRSYRSYRCWGSQPSVLRVPTYRCCGSQPIGAAGPNLRCCGSQPKRVSNPACFFVNTHFMFTLIHCAGRCFAQDAERRSRRQFKHTDRISGQQSAGGSTTVIPKPHPTVALAPHPHWFNPRPHSCPHPHPRPRLLHCCCAAHRFHVAAAHAALFRAQP